jgi:ABC-type multidrug transport system ATPase subunit
VLQVRNIHSFYNPFVTNYSGQRSISGGEKRRVSIACELVTSPSILFLDEPTSGKNILAKSECKIDRVHLYIGLDSFNAYNVVESLVALAHDYNRTVVFTIHQPRSNIVALFDQLVLLAKGRTVYSGPFEQCQSYFSSIGFACPPGFNIADYLSASYQSIYQTITYTLL